MGSISASVATMKIKSCYGGITSKQPETTGGLKKISKGSAAFTRLSRMHYNNTCIRAIRFINQSSRNVEQ